MNEQPDDDELIRAVNIAMFTLRIIAGVHPVCPRCFCDAVIDQLEKVGRDLEHGEPLPEIEIEIVPDPIGPTEGSA